MKDIQELADLAHYHWPFRMRPADAALEEPEYDSHSSENEDFIVELITRGDDNE